ncbi:MAG: hypothetical protein Q9174_002099 [Haloplaca sp. 1 TL-2023]
MGRIKKAAGPKHEATVSPAIAEFVTIGASLPVAQLPAHLHSFPILWPFPRGDLYHWIPLLNRFDTILERFCQEYGLQNGPQNKPFGRILLETGVVEEGKSGVDPKTSTEGLDKLGFAPDGDKELAAAILSFSRVLLENCGNRSLYSSSDRLGGILNTVDLSLLASALQLATRLAQRYHASKQRGNTASQHLNNALLASHYNIDLEKVQHLANPFSKPTRSAKLERQASSSRLSGSKAKEKASVSQAPRPSSIHPADLMAIASQQTPTANGLVSKRDSRVPDQATSPWSEWGNVQMRYYQAPSSSQDGEKTTSPTTPTPTRRPSNLSRVSRPSTSEESEEVPSTSSTSKNEEASQGGMKSLEIPSSKFSSASPISILNDNLAALPKDAQYELLARIRVADAMTTSLSTRQELLTVRLLALTNLAYVYPDTTFQQKVLQPDSDEPRRLQLTYQLADLLQPPRNGDPDIPLHLQTVALGTLESLTKHKSRAPDVSAALNINVNHGILLQTLKKATKDLASEDETSKDHDAQHTDWCNALFSLLDALPNSSPRTSDTLIAAGLFDVLVDMLRLRTDKAERYHYKVLTFLNTIVYTVRDAFQTLANAKGLDTISDLLDYEVKSSLERANVGEGISKALRNQVVDYRIPYFQQQTLRWIFKFVNHMMSHGGGTFDRLLRNLIDSPQLLGALKTVIVKPKMFGASIWSGAVNVLSSFIHNEPTSYGIIAEAGLSKGFLESVSAQSIQKPEPDNTEKDAASPSGEDQAQSTAQASTSEALEEFEERVFSLRSQDRVGPLAQGILPAGDAILVIPQAFGAICLNNSGLNLFLRSSAMSTFFEVFESPEHLKSMSGESDLPRALGNSFDELVRHYPQLKAPVMQSVLLMIERVFALCRSRASKQALGAKLWIDAGDGKPKIAGGIDALGSECHPGAQSRIPMREIGDVTMEDADGDQGSTSAVDFDRLTTDATADETTASYVGTVMKFLCGFFENTNICASFVSAHGVEPLLEYTTLPSLQYDFNNQYASQEMSRVIHMLVESKPHIVMPSLVRRTQVAVDVLEPLCDQRDGLPYFAKYTIPNQATTEITDGSCDDDDGTLIVQNLVAVHTLCNILFEAFSPPIYNSRTSHTVFTQVNLTDMYVTLIKSLGRLHRVCVWEEILLQKAMPETWKEATKVKGYGMGSQEADDVFGLISRDESALEGDETQQGAVVNGNGGADTGHGSPGGSNKTKRRQSSIRKDESTPQFQNVRVLRYLLSQLPSSIVPFFQGLGKALIAKRRPDTYARQSAYMIADAMSTATLEQLKFEVPRETSSAKDRYSYWIVILTSISQLLIEGKFDFARSAFKQAGGLEEVKSLLEIFFDEVKLLSNPTKGIDMTDAAARLATAYGGIKIILNLYTQITGAKIVVESPQTSAIQSNERDRGQAHYFLPQQFLVELRMAVLPVVRSIWDSDFVDHASSSIVKCLVEILRICLECNEEAGAYKRGDKLPVRAKHTHRVYNITEEKMKSLKDMGYYDSIAREALYRCYNGQHAAQEYCNDFLESPPHYVLLKNHFPIPEYDQEPKKDPENGMIAHSAQSGATVSESELSTTPPGSVPSGEHSQASRDVAPTADSTAPAPPAAAAESADTVSGSTASQPAPAVPDGPAQASAEAITMSIDNLLNFPDVGSADVPDTQQNPSPGHATPATAEQNLILARNVTDLVTVNDLDDERAAIRENLVERAVNVLNIHADVTFELADLIAAAALKASDSSAMRRDIGETLVQSLISLQSDDDFRSEGKKIAAYANLLGLVLQDDDFYQATLDELKSNFSQLLAFIKIFPDQKPDESSPWIGQVLLVVERVLSEDAQPIKIHWTPPSPDTVPEDTVPEDTPMASLGEPVLPLEDKTALFDALIEMLPRVGKDDSLALSVVRALAIVTRHRSIADKLAEKKNIQRLFVMMKQLAGSTGERLQSSFMLIIRHLIEDDETVRQVMRSEILQNFETRPSRATDTTGYVRQMYHLVLRNPELFVEVTNEKLEIKEYNPGDPHRPQLLMLKPEVKAEAPEKTNETEETQAGAEREVEQQGGQEQPSDVNKSAEGEQVLAAKSKAVEIKAPIIENPSGVIHYILCELLSYKDVEDKDPSSTGRKSSETVSHEMATEGVTDDFTVDTEIHSLARPRATPTSEPGFGTEESGSKKVEKPQFKAEQHPIYVYRCFLLQCLTELLNSYNRTKIEFINFSRKIDPKAMTPSKPRSGILNYLLSDLIPVGTLNHDESIAFRKKSITSNWALSAVVALCLKTNENGYSKRHGPAEEEDDSDLLFVRKFVLEQALKAYRDANASTEALDVKYARMLCLADLFDRLLQGRLGQASTVHGGHPGNAAQKQIARIMFEKNFLSALTASIADIDLNFPQSKRAVKYILKPLKQLTSTAIHLSETSDISTTPGQTDDDEISSASSVSELDEQREETPDLFRNSTLGMFEPGREEESSSDSSDEDGDDEMYDDGYDNGMEYEDEMERDADEVISDEDEDIAGAGHIEGLSGDMVQIVVDGEGDGASDDEDDEDESISDDEGGSEGMNDDLDADEALEALEEITGDDNGSLGDDGEGDWQDEDDDEEMGFDVEEEDMAEGPMNEDEVHGADAAVRDIMREYGGAEEALQRLREDGTLEMDIDDGEAPYGDEDGDEAEEGEEDEEEDEGEGDLLYQPDYVDDDQGMPEPPPWAFDTDDAHFMPPPRHHHHHPRRIVSPWTVFPGHPSDRGSIYRSHRPTGGPRSADDGTNPLLRRQGRNPEAPGISGLGQMMTPSLPAGMSDFWVHGMDHPGTFPRSPMAAESPVSFVNNIIAAIGQGGPGLAMGGMGGPPGGPFHFTIGGGPGGTRPHTIPRELQALLGIRPTAQDAARAPRDDSNQTSTFTPQTTPVRWQEEARLLFGSAHLEKAQRIIDLLLRVMVPPAIARKKQEEEQTQRMMEEREKKRREKEEAEKAEKEEREKQEREAHAAAELAEAEMQMQADQAEHTGDTTESDPGAMEGVETTNAEEDSSADDADGLSDTAEAQNQEAPTSAPEAAATNTAAPEQRVRTSIRGRELDITGMGVDLEYLEALPEDLREEVLMHQLAVHRSQAVAAGEAPSDISREFLEALPPNIRDELLQQEAQDRRRREREEERRRRATEGGPPARAEEMDTASFLASLDPGLRQTVLMDQDEEILAQLPQAIAAEARALGADRGHPGGYRGYAMPGHRVRTHAPTNDLPLAEREGSKKTGRKQIVQMLDKAGVATLLRLMFVPQQGSSRSSLNNILHDISQNRQTRAEVISLLLSILQDGSTDVNAVERSFAHLSLRAKQPSSQNQKTPQPLKRALTGTMVTASNSEMTPLMVVQQCLHALVFLTQYNPHIPSFFLTEHEVSTGLRGKSNRKGKGKESKAQKFALNALLSLLDRKLIMESSTCMEQLSSLLQAVTHPLTMLLRAGKEKNGKDAPVEASEVIDQPMAHAEEGATTVTEVQTGESEAQPAGPTSVDTSSAVPGAATEAPPVEGPMATDPAAETTGPDAEKPKDESSKSEEEKSKKARTLTPPVVPEENLRLVVNILAARECSAKTFRDTLSTINNLSSIPEAKEVFGKGLIEQAQDLGQSILNDLDELVPQIKQAKSAADVQGMALTKFSPASSDQAKLLRILTALDYLFDPKRNNGKTKSGEDDKTPDEASGTQQDVLASLYENATFAALWSKLSDCLTAIRGGEGMLNIATILLPLIEALMVVCKNTAIKDAPLVKAVKDFAVSSPAPESGMENLFFRFTEDHRKILNDLVRNNPKLMSGTFSLLVKNPKVLEFDNKRNYFTRRLHSRGTEARHPQPPLQLNIRREQVFLDSYKYLHFKSGDEIKYGKLNIRFHGEEGVDAGGVSREWFQVLSRQMFNPDYALFVPVASDRTTFHPNKLSKVNEEHLDFFKFIGRIIGKALYEGRALDCHFSRAVYKRILGKTVSIKDMETLDLDYYKSLLWMLEHDITDIITETFSTETNDFGVIETVDLIENGRNIPVTDDNKQEFVQLMVEYRLTGSVQAQLEKFLGGFHDVVSPELIAIFNEQELELLISGLPDINIDDWKAQTEYHNYSASSSQIQWFWRAVRSFDKEERAKLLQFVTGTAKVPLNGFAQLEGMNGVSKFNIHRDYGNKDRLPSSHTCFNQLDLPEYESYEQLRQQVYTAMTAGSEYFGFA